jgi:formate-dependent nitrite reductase membrane component NrfD
MLKPPVWSIDIPLYFFLGGLSAGAYLLARVVARLGGGQYKEVTQAGTAIAAAAIIPCPLLLIHDLGDWKRFIYMLRVFKPKSPMNLGSWVLSGYSTVAALAALNQLRKARRERTGAGRPSLPVRVADGAVEAIADGAGVPLSLLLAGYTGVLLSTTSTPLWARNAWLGPLFSAGAISTGASAIQLARELTDSRAEERPAHEPLQKVEMAAKAAEAITMVGYLASAGSLAQPITKGRYAPLHRWGAVGAGLVLSTALGRVPVKSAGARRALRVAGAVAGLAGGLALRWVITQAGHDSGKDPIAARKASR